MRLILYRTKFFETSTIGRLYLDENFICWTCEDKDRKLSSDMTLDQIKAIKVPSETAIPYGTYKLAMTMSNRFKKVMPLLLNVPGFDGIRIHSGNTRKDTEGCILPGLVNTGDSVINSKLATVNVYKIVTEGLKYGEFYIDIRCTK
jgi:hypothetical protein